MRTGNTGDDQADAAEARGRDWLCKKNDAEDHGADGTYAGPNGIGRTERQRTHRDAEQNDA
ncbi:hypothetical protein ABIA19_002168 [Sinorhizobium fredii]